MEYYTYILIDPRNDKLFYVGCGQKKRMYQHEKDVQRNRVPNGTNTKLGNKIKKILSIGKKVKYKKIFITENRQEAFDKEIEMIEEIGIKNLCNLVDGGKGGGIIGRELSDETRRKISESMKGIKRSEETKRKISESLKGNEYNLGKKLSDEHKQKISANHVGMLGKFHTEETKKKISDFNKGKHLTDETKQKMSESHIKYWKNK